MRSEKAPAAVLAALTLLAGAGARLGWPLLRGPAPWPPEWQWGFDPKPADLRLLPALLGALALLALVRIAGRVASRRGTAAVLLAATAAGGAFQVALLHVEREGAVAELVRRTARGSYTSYHRVALSPAAADPWEFLARHAELLPALRKGTPHAATHPPGPVLLYRGMLGLARTWPALGTAAEDVAGRAGLDLGSVQPPLQGEGAAAALLGSALLGLLGAAACWPVHTLARRYLAPGPALAAAVLWPLVPGVALMVPELDQALALPAAAAVALLAAALAAGSRWVPAALLAGVVTGLALFFSYGVAVPIAIGGLAVVAAHGPGPRAGRVAAVALVAAAAVFLAPALLGHQPVAALRAALAIHREQFTAHRSYLAWLAAGPLDLALFLGPPLAALLVLRVGSQPIWSAAGGAVFRLAVIAGSLLLFLSGTVRGEVGRILIPLMPLLLVAALAPGRRSWSPSPVLVGALLAFTDLVLRVSWRLP